MKQNKYWKIGKEAKVEDRVRNMFYNWKIISAFFLHTILLQSHYMSTQQCCYNKQSHPQIPSVSSMLIKMQCGQLLSQWLTLESGAWSQEQTGCKRLYSLYKIQINWHTHTHTQITIHWAIILFLVSVKQSIRVCKIGP